MKISIGSDHRGYELKEKLKEKLSSEGHEVTDVGPSGSSSVDYPDYASRVAELVSCGQCDRGIMIDGAGVGSAIVACKVPGVRAVCACDSFTALNSRRHNDTNVLTLGSEVTGQGKSMELAKLWLETGYEGGRHQARIDKITALERKYSLDLSGIYRIVSDILAGLGRKSSPAQPQETDKKLITLEDAEKMSGPEMIVSKGTIITPSARDSLRDRGIIIRYGG